MSSNSSRSHYRSGYPPSRKAAAGASGTAGFTLLEVLISMFILAMIALGIYQATTETFRLRDILSSEGDFYNGIRLSMDILGRDFSLIFNPAVIQPDAPKKTTPGQLGGGVQPQEQEAIREAQDLANSDAGQVSKFWLPAIDKTGLRPSRFQGTDSSMSFIAVSHIRIYRDSPESELAKITYELGKDDSNKEDTSAQVLIKTESANVFETEDRKDRFVHTYPILRGVKSFKIQYYRADKGTMADGFAWVNSWDNSKDEFKDHLYPDAIRIKVEVKGVLNLNFEGTYVFRTEVPLNGLDPSL